MESLRIRRALLGAFSTISRQNLRAFTALFVFIFELAFPSNALAQNKVDLEDMTIKGELINDDRLRMSSRESQSMKEKIGYRANFRKEIIDNKEVSWPSNEIASMPVPSAPTMPDPVTAPIAAPLAAPGSPPVAEPVMAPLASRTTTPAGRRAPASVTPPTKVVGRTAAGSPNRTSGRAAEPKPGRTANQSVGKP